MSTARDESEGRAMERQLPGWAEQVPSFPNAYVPDVHVCTARMANSNRTTTSQHLQLVVHHQDIKTRQTDRAMHVTVFQLRQSALMKYVKGPTRNDRSVTITI